MTKLAKTLGFRIKCLREEQGMSQRDFCLMIGMNQSYFAGVELGKRNPSLKNIEKIMDGLDVTAEKLFLGL